jgi:ADP-ribose pyrophosphatase YjhB (NUDIX family)
MESGATSSSGLGNIMSGHLRQGETIIDGIIREAGEETGIMLAPGDLDLPMSPFPRRVHRPSLFFTAKSWRGEIETARAGQMRRLAVAAAGLAAGQRVVPYADKPSRPRDSGSAPACSAGPPRSHNRQGRRHVR